MADETVTLVLEKAVAGGRSLARLDGRVVLVSGGIPGERVRAAIERTGKGLAFARVVEVDDASPDRIEPPSDPRCGGLAFAHVAYHRQLTLKCAIVEDALARIGGLRELPPIEVAASPERQWRLRARLHVSGRRVGFFLEGTHTLCDAAPSGQLVPGLLALAEDTMARLQPPVVACVEAMVVTETLAGDRQAVHLELARPLPRHGPVWVEGEDKAQATATRPAGVSAALAGSRHPVTIAGDPHVRESLVALGVPEGAEIGLVRHAASFFQGNRALLPHLVAHVTAAVRGHSALVDLYAGVGLFGLAATAATGVPATLVEGDPVSAEDLVTNAASFGSQARAVRGDVETFVRDRRDWPDGACVIVDPPRTGLAPTVVEGLSAAAPPRLVYVSCDPATLARDLRALTAAGLRLASLRVFDMFPVTAHVETVAVLERG